ncbi:MAG TPA: hypothetical protein VJA21_03540 [Verrucomicrobiae bacterium]
MKRILLPLCFLCACFALGAPAPSNFEALHDIGRLGRFGTTNQIRQFFQTNSLSFEVPALKRHTDRYFWVVSYPYSGMDTIDLYCFRGGPGGWVPQMLYFVLKPTDRHITVDEQDSQFVVRCGHKQLLTFSIEP